MFRALILVLTCLLGCTPLRQSVPEPDRLALSSSTVPPAGVELLRDPTFSQGVTQGYANHLPREERRDCLARWQSRGLTDAQWAFWEISERLYFAHNPATPVASGSGTFTWATTDLAKQCHIANGKVRLVFDSGKEWREGGSLWLADANGSRPRYGNQATTWPHFLVGQHLAANNDPMYLLPEPEKLLVSRYDRLRFSLEVKLNRLERSSTWDHRQEFGAANHALFYIGFAVMPRTARCIAERGKFYILIPAIYSEGGAHLTGSAPWLGIDQFGDGVYFSGSPALPHLETGSSVHYDVDVKELIREGFAAVARRSAPATPARSAAPEDNFVAVLLIGWEVWGGFATDVEFRGLSLRGYGSPLGAPEQHPGARTAGRRAEKR